MTKIAMATAYDSTLFAAPFLTWDELACWNRLGRPWEGVLAGEMVAPFPLDWRHEPTRLPRLLAAWTEIRERVGVPIVIGSAFRTHAYNVAVGGAVNAQGVSTSQHVQGRALDLHTPTGWTLERFENLVLSIAPSTSVRFIQVYGWGLHVDVRPTQVLRVVRSSRPGPEVGRSQGLA